MKIEKHDGSDEKTVLTGMIVDDHVLGRIVGKWTGEMFRSKWSNLVAGWCVRHFERYNHAPGKKIQHLFERWAEKSKDEPTVNMVETFLSGLSDEYEELQRESNSDYVLDTANRHFALVQMERLKEDLEDRIADKDPDKAAELLTGFNRIQLGMGEGVDVLHDKEAWKSAYGPHTESLIEFPGALGQFFGNTLARHSFVAFEGPEGRGKSFWLQECAFRAILQRRKVAFFELGDMTRDQIMERMGVRFAETPLEYDVREHKGKIDWPKQITFKETEKDGKKNVEANVVTEPRRFSEGMDWRKAWKACRDICQKRVKSDDPYWLLFNYAPDVLHCRDIEGKLIDLERTGWVADVVVVDYADILSMNYSGYEGRDRINKTWEHLRKISVEHHCLVLTATQTDAASYDAWLIRRRNFSEDKRKYAHVTAINGLNQTPAEKEQGIMRLNNLKKRRGGYSETQCVWVAGCLELANPAVRSAFPRT